VSKNVNDVIVDLFCDKETISSSDLAKELNVSRQAAHKHLRRLVERGELERVGAGRGSRYRRPRQARQQQFHYETSGLEEDRVWDEVRRDTAAIGAFGEKAQEILQYAVTELVNNVIDHSGADQVRVDVEGDEQVALTISDEGVGLFKHVQQGFGLATELEALQELSKGKTTTMPARHSGEGLFFVSKAVDLFEVESGELRWLVDNVRCDMVVEDLETPHQGTAVTVTISTFCERELAAIFEEYTEDFEFIRTKQVIKLYSIGVRFVSRSEGKRLMHGLERFREVVLDFKGVRGVGQAFADEVFRVWPSIHSHVTLIPVNMSRSVEFMVRRAQAHASK
jgi:anti-sigma regulatory factor (Ser/Thr protein kinase)/biotin operon repressor